MCDFISFFVSVKNNRLICGYPYSHRNAPVHSALDDWREAEWTEYGLVIRTTDADDLNAYRATVLALCKTRSDLCEYLSPSENINGTAFYFNEKGIHRTGDQPAIIRANGTIEYFENDKRHRAGDQPARIRASGTKEYFENDKRHRAGDQPAIIWSDGTIEFWDTGKCHRAGDKPAVIGPDGTIGYWVDDKLHRAGGKPAIIQADGTKEYWENGVLIK